MDEHDGPRFASQIEGHEVLRVHEMGWRGIQDGELLRLAHQEFGAFVTLDRDTLFQHDHQGQDLRVAILRSAGRRFDYLVSGLPELRAFLAHAQPDEKREILGSTPSSELSKNPLLPSMWTNVLGPKLTSEWTQPGDTAG